MKLLILAFLSLIPCFVSSHYFPGNLIIPTVQGLVSELAIIFIFLYFKKQKMAKWFLISFTSLFVADLIFSMTNNNVIRESLLLTKVSEIGYIGFVFGTSLLTFNYYKNIKFIQNKVILFFLATFIFYLNYKYVLNPFYTRDPKPEIFYMITAFIYSVFGTMLFSTSLINSLISTKKEENLFFQSFVLLGLSDFAIRYSTAFGDPGKIGYFSYGWTISVSLIAMVCLISKGSSFISLSEKVRPSVKVYITLLNAIILLFFLSLLHQTGQIRTLDNASKLSSIMFVFFVCWMFVNVIAIYSTGKVVNFVNYFNLKLSKFDEHDYVVLKKNDDKIYFFEFEVIKSKYNEIVTEYNYLQQKNAENLKYVSIANAAKYMAHDIRKPFSSVMAFINSFEKIQKNPQMLNAFRENIKASCDNANSMLEDMLDVSRESELECKHNCLKDLIEKSETIVKVGEAFPGIIVEKNFKHLSKVAVHDQKFIRILTNILQNAVEAITEMGNSTFGKIIISTEEKTSFIELKIWNSGPAIPSGNLQKIFSPSHTRGKSKGTGLGLAVVKKLLEMQKAEIEAVNESNGVAFNLKIQKE